MPKQREIIGHNGQCDDLLADIECGNVAHAYLLTGPRHIGKLTVAHWFASKLLTQGIEESKRDSTLKNIDQLTYSDLLVLDTLWIEGVSDDWDEIAKHSNIPQQHRSKKPTAKTDKISIDDIRGLQERLRDTSLGTYRVCIIRSVERMQDAAANAFLKILEEPPAGLVFILTSQAQNTLLPTVISRARVMPFQRLSYKQIMPSLSDMSDDDRQFILGLSQGAPGIALTLRDDPDLLRKHKQIHAQAHSFWNTASFRERLKIIQPLEKRTDDADSLLLHLALTLREHHDSTPVKPLIDLTAGLRTNAHRQLLTQKFVLQVCGSI